MKILCVFLLAAFLTTDVFGLNLRNKRQAETNNNNLEDRYGFMLPQWYPTRLPPQWNTPPMPDRRFPGQTPNFGQNPYPRFYPDPSLYPGLEMYPYPGPYPNPMFPNPSPYPNPQFPNPPPYPNPQFPDQGQFLFPGSIPGVVPNPGQGLLPGSLPGAVPNPGQGVLPGSLPGAVPNPGQVPFPGQGILPDQTQQTTQNPINGTTTPAASDPTFDDCIANCPVTAEYNPVCGTNNVTYPNPGRLYCAQACGTNVNLLRSSPCPTTTAAPPPS